jgi:hypothetical protein
LRRTRVLIVRKELSVAYFSPATKEITAKIVYYGPGMCGKTTNLQKVHQLMRQEMRGDLVSVATETGSHHLLRLHAPQARQDRRV